MKAVVKYKLYLMTFLATMLFMVGTAVGDNQTDPPIGDTTQMTKKPTIIILGSSHLANPGADVYNTKMDDVLAPKRQAELQQLVEQLARFKPTKIAVEVDARSDTELQAEYDAYLDGNLQLKRHEIHQVAFRLAKQMGHPKVYCVDYFWTERAPRLPESKIDWDLMDRYKFAETHNQEHFLRPPPIEGKITRDKDGTTWIEPEKYVSIIDMYIRDNDPESSLADHQAYLRSARIGLGDQYPGANWVAHSWYARNLKICINLTRITESADDRILLIIGAGHVFLVQQFLEDSGDYIVESPLDYLSSEETQ